MRRTLYLRVTGSKLRVGIQKMKYLVRTSHTPIHETRACFVSPWARSVRGSDAVYSKYDLRDDSSRRPDTCTFMSGSIAILIPAPWSESEMSESSQIPRPSCSAGRMVSHAVLRTAMFAP